VKPDAESRLKITPELLAEDNVEPAGTSPLTERLASYQIRQYAIWLVIRESEPGRAILDVSWLIGVVPREFLSSLCGQGIFF